MGKKNFFLRIITPFLFYKNEKITLFNFPLSSSFPLQTATLQKKFFSTRSCKNKKIILPHKFLKVTKKYSTPSRVKIKLKKKIKIKLLFSDKFVYYAKRKK